MARTENRSRGLDELKEAARTGDFARLYFFHGEEKYLQEYYLSVMVKKLVAGPMEAFNHRRFAMGETTFAAVREAVEAMPMMADATLVQIDDYNPFAQPKTERIEWAALLSDIPDYCHVVFTFDAVPFSKKVTVEKDGDSGKEKDRLSEVVKQYGCEVVFDKQSPAELTEWVTRHFRAAGKKIPSNLCQYLIFLTDGTMTRLLREIEKISAYSAADTIVREDIDAVTVPTLTAALFDVSDALAEGNYDAALGKLDELLRLQEEPIAILGAMGSLLRRLNLVKAATSAGKNTAEIQDLLGTKSDYYVRKLISQSGKLSAEYLTVALAVCFDADCRLKRSAEDAPALLQECILRMAQEARK